MRNRMAILTVAASLAACSMSPPAPPAVRGEFRPINPLPARIDYDRPAVPAIDFDFEGDVSEALAALREQFPQLTISNPQGIMRPRYIRVHLRTTSLEHALKAIGEQGGGLADVVLVTSYGKPQGAYRAFIRYTLPKSKGQE